MPFDDGIRRLGRFWRHTLRESNEGSILASVGSVLRSLVELGLMAKSGPGEYQLTEEDFRVGQSLGGKYPIV